VNTTKFNNYDVRCPASYILLNTQNGAMQSAKTKIRMLKSVWRKLQKDCIKIKKRTVSKNTPDTQNVQNLILKVDLPICEIFRVEKTLLFNYYQKQKGFI